MKSNNRYGILFTLLGVFFLAPSAAAIADDAGYGRASRAELWKTRYWAREHVLPDQGGSADGVVGTNIATFSDGELVVFYPIADIAAAGTYGVRSGDGGKTWTTPVKFPPGGPGTHSIQVFADADDKLHAAWVQKAPVEGVYYAFSTDRGDTWSAAVRLSGEVRYTITGPIMTVDRKGRVHVNYFDGDADDPARPSEIHYTRSVDNGATWETAQRLSTDDDIQSTWGRADFSGVDGDRLAIVWRDERPGFHWDIYGAFSEDGGATWTERLVMGGPGTQWDPMSVVDKNGVIHVGIMEEPAGNPFNVRILYTRSADGGLSWTTPVELSTARSRFPFLSYDHSSNVLWLFWKDERDFDESNGNPQADIVGRFSYDGGDNWSELEYLTDAGTADVRFPAFSMGPDGRPGVVYSYGDADSDAPFTVYHRTRRQAP